MDIFELSVINMKDFILQYLLSSIFLFLGLLSFRSALKNQSQEDKVKGRKEISMHGKGGRIHFIYIGCVLIALSLFLMFRTQ